MATTVDLGGDDSDGDDDDDDDNDDDNTPDDDVAQEALIASILQQYSKPSSSLTSTTTTSTTSTAVSATVDNGKRVTLRDGLEASAYFDLRGLQRHKPSRKRNTADDNTTVVVGMKNAGKQAVVPDSLGNATGDGHSDRKFSAQRKDLSSFDQLQRGTRRRDVNAFHRLQTPELTPQVKKDLQVLQLRSYMDPKKFYKNDKIAQRLPKRFEIGTYVEDAFDRYHQSKQPRKLRAKNYQEMLVKDPKIRAYAKRKYGQLQEANQARGRKKHKKKFKGRGNRRR